MKGSVSTIAIRPQYGRDPSSVEALRFDGLTINPQTRTLVVQHTEVRVTAKEFDLLYFLASHRGQVFTREQLLNQVWDYIYTGDSSTVTVHIRRLREKIEADSLKPRYIKTGRGCRLQIRAMRDMIHTRKTLTIGAATLLGLSSITLLLIIVMLRPPAGELAALTAFIGISGALTMLVGVGLARVSLPRQISSLRARIMLASVLTAVLALINVGFTATLMFLSGHDLVLLVSLVGFALGVSIFVGYYLSSSTVGHLLNIVDAARRISAGNIKVRVPVYVRDEVGELAAAFNVMMDRLEASFNRHKELEQARKDLIVAVSHDLRTPLASIRAMVEGINDGVVNDQSTIMRYMRTVEAEVEHLSQLIDDLFELSQIEAGVLELHMENSSITDLISDTLASMSAQARVRNVNLKGAVDAEISAMMMDARWVQRVLYNLVQNAIRHTATDGTVYIQASNTGTGVQIEIIDTGEGIPARELPHLFKRFYRSDSSRSRDSGGAGLGLSIAKGIVEAHGGQVWVKSIIGKGSTFGFVLPKSPIRRTSVGAQD